MSIQFYSPLDQFEVVSLISLNMPIFNSFNLSLTNLGLYTIITVTVVTLFHVFGNNNKSIYPSRWSISQESMYAGVLNLVRSQLGQNNEIYLPFIYSLFFFLLFANLNGNIPYGFTLTSSIVVCLGLSVIIFIGVTILAVSLHRVHFFSFFVPSGTPFPLVFLLVPIELISYLARAASLGVRLFANILSGHALLKIVAQFMYPMFTSGIITAVVAVIPFGIFIAIVGLEVAVSFIQAYVFCILTSSYIADAIKLH